MILRRAIALALVGWYLLAPPVYVPKDAAATSLYKPFAAENEPLSRWTNFGSFDSAADCQKERAKNVAQAFAHAAANSEEVRAVNEAWKWMTCVSTDDPRLKEK
jgi:hypothetical protein